jgi:undecaprenyl-diphosphatase
MFKLIEPLDSKIVKYIHLHRYKGADDILIWLTEHATFITISTILLLFVVFFATRKKYYLYLAVNFSFIISISALITGLLKITIKRTRPYHLYHEIISVVESGGYSFPSGHTTEVVAFAVAGLIMIKNKFINFLLILWATFIAYTRMAMGVHYPFDLLGGIVVGGAVAYLWLRLDPFKKLIK